LLEDLFLEAFLLSKVESYVEALLAEDELLAEKHRQEFVKEYRRIMIEDIDQVELASL
jgi:hypothetical protein